MSMPVRTSFALFASFFTGAFLLFTGVSATQSPTSHDSHPLSDYVEGVHYRPYTGDVINQTPSALESRTTSRSDLLNRIARQRHRLNLEPIEMPISSQDYLSTQPASCLPFVNPSHSPPSASLPHSEASTSFRRYEPAKEYAFNEDQRAFYRQALLPEMYSAWGQFHGDNQNPALSSRPSILDSTSQATPPLHAASVRLASIDSILSPPTVPIPGLWQLANLDRQMALAPSGVRAPQRLGNHEKGKGHANNTPFIEDMVSTQQQPYAGVGGQDSQEEGDENEDDEGSEIEPEVDHNPPDVTPHDATSRLYYHHPSPPPNPSSQVVSSNQANPRGIKEFHRYSPWVQATRPEEVRKVIRCLYKILGITDMTNRKHKRERKTWARRFRNRGDAQLAEDICSYCKSMAGGACSSSSLLPSSSPIISSSALASAPSSSSSSASTTTNNIINQQVRIAQALSTLSKRRTIKYHPEFEIGQRKKLANRINNVLWFLDERQAYGRFIHQLQKKPWLASDLLSTDEGTFWKAAVQLTPEKSKFFR